MNSPSTPISAAQPSFSRPEWPTVSGRLPLTLDAVDQIAAINDPAVRNLWISQSYADLAHRMLELLGSDQTWCSFAIWASNTAGVSIRGEELPTLVERLLLGADHHVDAVTAAINHHTAQLRRTGLANEIQRSHIADLVGRAVVQVAGFLADGNNLVYRELAPIFVRFLEHHEAGSDAPSSELEAWLDSIGVPPLADAPHVRSAFRSYALALATTEPSIRAQHVLAANVAAVLHEQQRLQPDIERALDAGLCDVGDDLAGALVGHHGRALLGPLVRLVRREVHAPIERLWDHVATELLMTMQVPGQTLRLRESLPLAPGAERLFPEVLGELTETTLRSLMAAWDPTHGSGVGCGATNWALLSSRMGYIVNLFRSRQRVDALTVPPFDDASLRFMEHDVLPPNLGHGEPQAVRSTSSSCAVPAPCALPAAASRNSSFVVVRHGIITDISDGVAAELGIDPSTLRSRIDLCGTTLDDHGFDELLGDAAHSDQSRNSLRVRLNAGLHNLPVRFTVLARQDDVLWLEVRSLAAEFRMESLLRRSGLGHMLLSPSIDLKWSLSADGMLPGDNPLNWVQLMDPDDMQVLGKAIFDVGQNPHLVREVRHRLHGERTYTMLDRVESVVHDPDLGGVLVRSRLEGAPIPLASSDAAVGGVANAGVGGGVDPHAASFGVSDHMTIGVIVASGAGVILHRNAAAASLVRARGGQSVLPVAEGSWLLGRSNPGDIELFTTAFQAATKGTRGEVTIASPVEASRWIRVALTPGPASTVVMTIEDMTNLAEAERALRASNSLLAALDAHSEELVVVFRADGSTKYLSSSVRRHIGPAAEITTLEDLLGYVNPLDRLTVARMRAHLMSDVSQPTSADVRVTVGDPAGRWHHATMTNLLADPDVEGVVLTLRDVHERHLLEHELRFRATHDELTTLPDRTALRTRLEEVLDEGERSGRRTGLVFCDIDNFKTINDTYGHHFGDFVLTELASRLRASLRVSDFVGRFGGDEFVVVVPDVDDEDHALALAAGIFNQCMGPATLGQQHVEISVSMGLAVSDPTGATLERLMQQADLAMYRSKRSGRGRLSLFSEHRAETVTLG